MELKEKRVTKGREERKETEALLDQREILALGPAPGVEPVEKRCVGLYSQYVDNEVWSFT